MEDYDPRGREGYDPCEVHLLGGKTDGANIPFMPSDKTFMMGYNSKHGLLNVYENGPGENFYFKGRVNIENLLPKRPLKEDKETDSRVYNHIMTAYMNMRDYQRNPEKHSTPPEPILEVLVDGEK